MTGQRKHASQMTQAERQFVEGVIHGSANWQVVSHATVKAQQRKVSHTEVLETLKTGSVIEVHQNAYPDIRALVRKTFATYSVCVVVSLISKRIITNYINSANDHHATLNTSEYQWKADITTLRLAAR